MSLVLRRARIAENPTLVDVVIEGGLIKTVTPSAPAVANGATEIDAGGCVVTPGFVDCHTHLCYAGSRLDEWDQKRRGVPYLDILAAGGGIMSTVRAVRNATQRELVDLTLERLNRALELGTTTIEIKSGYGLSTRDELKMLRAIADAASRWPGTVVATALLGHAVDPDVPRERFINTTINETLDAVHAEFPGVAVDAFCEQAAWTVDECVALFTKAASLGHPIRVHADQFTSLGMVQRAIELGARSVDHLEASRPEDLLRLASSKTAGVGLPCCGFHLDNRYADLKKIVDAGGTVAVATNHNPGSAPCLSIPMAMAIAVRHSGLSPEQGIHAVTAAPAAVLGCPDRGRIAPGARADLVLLESMDARSLAFEFGSNPASVVIAGGRVVSDRRRR